MMKKRLNKFLRNKRAIELSANFLVMMILAIAMFGFGIYFTKQIFTKSSDYTKQMDAQTNEKIEELLNDGSRVVVPFQTKTIRRGSLGVFGIGVLNVLQDTKKFEIQVVDDTGTIVNYPSKAFDKAGGDITSPQQYVSVVYNTNFVELPNLGKNKFAIGVNVNDDAPSGTYVINVKVLVENASVYSPYDASNPVYKLYVVVP